MLAMAGSRVEPRKLNAAPHRRATLAKAHAGSTPGQERPVLVGFNSPSPGRPLRAKFDPPTKPPRHTNFHKVSMDWLSKSIMLSRVGTFLFGFFFQITPSGH